MHATTIHLTRTIDASHVIPNHPGKCSRLHGHTYRFDVWMRGAVNDETGMVVDFFDVKQAIDAWDHRHLNDEVSFIPTAELLAAEMQRRLLAILEASPATAAGRAAGITPQVLVRLWETPSSYAEVGHLDRAVVEQ